uniref:Uncharacterized protein n=1 Tax=Lactuca sativa TaxID=4236 RepID=A0A9R1W273_LACSA|nr:hypothetical protein LSAT_V11C300151860 [Lactuca sativa]
MKLVDVDRTLTRYLCDNTPIERFELMIDIENQDSTSLAEKWIRPVATKTCLKKISLTIFIFGAPFTLLDEILASPDLTKIKVRASNRRRMTCSVWMTTLVINYVSLP